MRDVEKLIYERKYEERIDAHLAHDFGDLSDSNRQIKKAFKSYDALMKRLDECEREDDGVLFAIRLPFIGIITITRTE